MSLYFYSKKGFLQRMGNEQSNTDKKNTIQNFNKNIDKNKLFISSYIFLKIYSDILLKQIFFTAQLNKDRRRGQMLTREKELLALVREAPNRRSKDNEYQKV